MIHQHNCHHRFGNRGGAYADARVMAAFGAYLNSLSLLIDAFARQPQAGGGF
jgi:hypothetical protein